jgi:hypothetical protein
MMDSEVDFVACDNPIANRTYPAIIKPEAHAHRSY